MGAGGADDVRDFRRQRRLATGPQDAVMPHRREVLALLCSAPGIAQSREEFRVYSEHPRLLLRPQKLRLLRRERERQSPRWQQFEMLVRGGAAMPEPAFAGALDYQISGNQESGLAAIKHALAAGADLRDIALVFDWCQILLTAEQSSSLVERLARGLKEKASAADVGAARSRAFAAIALADHGNPGASDQAIEEIVTGWWRRGLVPELTSGRRALSRPEVYALTELMHVIRDNLTIDLREGAGGYFADLPSKLLLSYYPAVWPAPENDYRIPMLERAGEPDLNVAAMARAAELALVGYDSSPRNAQFLQGWLIHDRFALRSPFGAPYEFLWANPYLPGLSYYHMPLFLHDEKRGELYLRSSWDDDAVWLGSRPGRAEVFRDGKRYTLGARARASAIDIGDASVVTGAIPLRLDRAADQPPNVFVIGLAPNTLWAVEVDDEELAELRSDPGGILGVYSTRKDARTIRIGRPFGHGQ
jgi:hypothetical protein